MSHANYSFSHRIQCLAILLPALSSCTEDGGCHDIACSQETTSTATNSSAAIAAESTTGSDPSLPEKTFEATSSTPAATTERTTSLIDDTTVPARSGAESLAESPTIASAEEDQSTTGESSTGEGATTEPRSPLGSDCSSPDDCESNHCENAGVGQVCCSNVCSNGTVCRADGQTCQECDPEARRCYEGLPQVCSVEGTWTGSEACTGETPVCVTATGECGTCAAGDVQCSNDSTRQSCNGSGLFESAACTGSTPACHDGECVECLPNARQCVGSTPQLCSPTGGWVTQAPCSGNTPVCDPNDGQCKCEAGSFRCDGADLMECNSAGDWTNITTCSGDLPTCNANSGRCECESGQRECRPGYAARYECIGGEWEVFQCNSPTDVCDDGSCVECVPGSEPICEDGNVRTSCSSNGIEVQEACAMLCEAGECRDTRHEAGPFICDIEAGLVCDSGETCCRRGENSCLAAGVSCQNPIGGGSPQTFKCDDHDDCPDGQQCCYRSYPAANTSCRATCDSSMGSSEWLCDTAHPCDSTQQCTGSISWLKLGYCQNGG